MAGARSTTIRAELTRVVLAAALPVWLASAVLLYEDQADDRALIERDARATARALMVAIDRDLASARTAAQVLATSPYLISGDLDAFYAQAKATLPTSGGNDLVLSDASAQEVLNTLRPYGEKLPRHGDPKLVERVFITGQPAVSDLYSNGVPLGRPQRGSRGGCATGDSRRGFRLGHQRRRSSARHATVRAGFECTDRKEQRNGSWSPPDQRLGRAARRLIRALKCAGRWHHCNGAPADAC